MIEKKLCLEFFLFSNHNFYQGIENLFSFLVGRKISNERRKILSERRKNFLPEIRSLNTLTSTEFQVYLIFRNLKKNFKKLKFSCHFTLFSLFSNIHNNCERLLEGKRVALLLYLCFNLYRCSKSLMQKYLWWILFMPLNKSYAVLPTKYFFDYFSSPYGNLLWMKKEEN